MWKIGILLSVITALLVGYIGTDALHSHLQHAFSRVPAYLLGTLYALTDASQRLMGPLMRFFCLKDTSSADLETGTGPFQPPVCLRNPLAESQLKKQKHISILGHVFDVSDNEAIYGPDGMYAFLTGRDSTRLLVSKEMDEKSFALEALTSAQVYELRDWFAFYSRKYKCIGHLPGLYFTPMGDPSDYLAQLFGLWRKHEPHGGDIADVLRPCTSFFDGKTLRISCNPYGSANEADSEEDLYPRQLLEPERATLRCACVPASLLSHARLRRYPECPADADHCLVKIDDAETVWTGRLSPPEAG